MHSYHGNMGTVHLIPLGGYGNLHLRIIGKKRLKWKSKGHLVQSPIMAGPSLNGDGLL